MLLPGLPLGPLCPLAPGYPLGPFSPVGPLPPLGPTGPTTSLGLSALFTGLVLLAGFALLTTGLGLRFLGARFLIALRLLANSACFFLAKAMFFFIAKALERVRNERVLFLTGLGDDLLAVFALSIILLNAEDLRTDEVFFCKSLNADDFFTDLLTDLLAFFTLLLSFLNDHPNSP